MFETVALCGRCCRDCIPLSCISLSLHLLCRIHSVENDLLDADITALGSSIGLLYFETISDQNMHSIGVDLLLNLSARGHVERASTRLGASI